MKPRNWELGDTPGANRTCFDFQRGVPGVELTEPQHSFLGNSTGMVSVIIIYQRRPQTVCAFHRDELSTVNGSNRSTHLSPTCFGALWIHLAGCFSPNVAAWCCRVLLPAVDGGWVLAPLQGAAVPPPLR